MEPQDSCIFFLSQEFKRSYVDHTIYFKRIQENSYVIITLYVDDLILAFNDLILLKDVGPQSDVDLETMQAILFQNAIGSFMYVMVCTRIDIA
jgi:hypothetical protein